MKWLLIVMLTGARVPAQIPFQSEAACEMAREKLKPMTNCGGLRCEPHFSSCVKVGE